MLSGIGDWKVWITLNTGCTLSVISAIFQLLCVDIHLIFPMKNKRREGGGEKRRGRKEKERGRKDMKTCLSSSLKHICCVPLSHLSSWLTRMRRCSHDRFNRVCKCTRADRCQNIMIEGMGSPVNLTEQSCLFWASYLPLVLMLFIVYFDVIFNWMENELFVCLFV